MDTFISFTGGNQTYSTSEIANSSNRKEILICILLVLSNLGVGLCPVQSTYPVSWFTIETVAEGSKVS